MFALQVLSSLDIPKRADWLQLGLHFPLQTWLLAGILIFLAVITLVPTYRVRAEILGTVGIILGVLLAIDGMMTMGAASTWAARNTISPDAAVQQVAGLSHFLDELSHTVDSQTFQTVYAALSYSKSVDDLQRATSLLIIPDLQRFELLNLESQKEVLIVSSNQEAQHAAYRINLAGRIREYGGLVICISGIVLVFMAHRLPH